ncbi:MAG TPA: hypothetical protein VJ228_12730 [Candidatus Acidoferrales bacterium]|jgi:hypothetical protein|nr:hypothetical protein [Candidatus Acidoferrales bacterium]
MSASVRDRAVRVLRWVLGVVVLWESCLFLRATILRAYSAGHVGVHGWIFLLLASVEIVAAAMFLAPAARVTGGYLLLTVFLFAAAFHILHGEFNEVGWLAVYSAAVVVCLTH